MNKEGLRWLMMAAGSVKGQINKALNTETPDEYRERVRKDAEERRRNKGHRITPKPRKEEWEWL